MLHPHTEVRFIDPQIGSGVFATQPIPCGTLVWVLDKFDRLYHETEVRQLEPVYQEILERYCFRNREGQWVFCWDQTRYINHSFRANCLATPYGCELAIRDILPGEEISNDYGMFNIIEPFECRPEPGIERTWVMPDDLLRYADFWDELLASAYLRFEQVEQPLLNLLPEPQRLALQAVARSEQPAKSVRENYCPVLPDGEATHA